MKFGHLERVSIKLKTLAPVHIGSGEYFTKKEYILDGKNGQIHFPDFPKLVALLKSRQLLTAYEDFLVMSRSNDLRRFLEDNGVGADIYHQFTRYSIDAGEALRNEKFRQVMTFIKDAEGLPYIPGSSLKGAIRTALGAWLISKDNNNRDAIINKIMRANDREPPRRYLKRETDELESRIFNRLDIHDPRSGRLTSGPTNDVMQGIRISDSAPIGYEQLTLAGKHERKPDGTINILPIFRESLIPGTVAELVMTLDMPVLKKVGINATVIEKALHSFADQHYENFEQHFSESKDDADMSTQQGVDIILGGGAGYVSKTLTYNLFKDRDKALELTTNIMSKNFPRHKHALYASRYKVAPHILKTTMYKGQYYQIGRCELILEQ